MWFVAHLHAHLCYCEMLWQHLAAAEVRRGQVYQTLICSAAVTLHAELHVRTSGSRPCLCQVDKMSWLCKGS